MKTLNEYINESLLDDLDDLEKDSDNAIEKETIEKFLKENYHITGLYTIKNGIVDVNGSVIVKTIKNNTLTSLTNGMFVFGTIRKNFDCAGCRKLTSLKGAPEKVGYSFLCHHCESLTSLEGAPKEVKGNFLCSNCTSLTSLEGAPKEVGGTFDCDRCASLTSLKGAPKEVGGSFFCSKCNTKFTKEQVSAVTKAKHIFT